MGFLFTDGFITCEGKGVAPSVALFTFHGGSFQVADTEVVET